MAKSRDAFRTISEVSDWLDTPAHVLRFWESKFSQIKPVKRAGGRRYYRPQDMALLGGIKTLLHEEGMTIKGAQKLLREKGVKHVSSLGPQPGETEEDAIDGIAQDVTAANEAVAAPESKAAALPDPMPDPQPETSVEEDLWPADPWEPEDDRTFETRTPAAQSTPEPITQSAESVEADDTLSKPERSIPALPDAAGAQARPGLLAVVASAEVAHMRKNISAILPLAAKLSEVHQRMSAR